MRSAKKTKLDGTSMFYGALIVIIIFLALFVTIIPQYIRPVTSNNDIIGSITSNNNIIGAMTSNNNVMVCVKIV